MEVTSDERHVAAQPVIEAWELYRFFHVGDDETFALRGVTLAVHPAFPICIRRVVCVLQSIRFVASSGTKLV